MPTNASFCAWRKALLFAFMVPAFAVPLLSQREPDNVLTAAQWREDLKYLADRIPKVHRNAFHAVSQDAFAAAVADIDRQIPSMSDHQVMVRFARLVAMLGDGHSRLLLPGLTDPMSDHPAITASKNARLAFHHLPVELYSFNDGLFVVGATAEFKRILGTKVLQIGNHSADEALQAISPIVNRDNEIGLKVLAPHFVAIPEVLQAMQVVPKDSPIALTFEARDGKTTTLELPSFAMSTPNPWTSVLDQLSEQPIRLRDPQKNYWFDYLADSRTMFVRINVIEDTPGESLNEFSRKLISFIDSHPVDRTVFDLRDSHGGNNQLFRSMLLGIIREGKIDRPGRLFVVLGRDTFSAAVNAASDLERLSDCIFVGEPAAGAPNSYGDARSITLPNSGLVVRLATVYWRDWTGDESRPWIAPDIATTVSSQDYFAGKDTALEAVLRLPTADSFSDVLMNVVRTGGGQESIFRLYYREKTDPRYASESTQQAMQRLGAYLVSTKSYKEATLAFRINARDYPDSVSAALQVVREALAKDPKDEGLMQLARQVESLAPNH